MKKFLCINSYDNNIYAINKYFIHNLKANRIYSFDEIIRHSNISISNCIEMHSNLIFVNFNESVIKDTLINNISYFLKTYRHVLIYPNSSIEYDETETNEKNINYKHFMIHSNYEKFIKSLDLNDSKIKVIKIVVIKDTDKKFSFDDDNYYEYNYVLMNTNLFYENFKQLSNMNLNIFVNIDHLDNRKENNILLNTYYKLNNLSTLEYKNNYSITKDTFYTTFHDPELKKEYTESKNSVETTKETNANINDLLLKCQKLQEENDLYKDIKEVIKDIGIFKNDAIQIQLNNLYDLKTVLCDYNDKKTYYEKRIDLLKVEEQKLLSVLEKSKTLKNEIIAEYELLIRHIKYIPNFSSIDENNMTNEQLKSLVRNFKTILQSYEELQNKK